MKRRGADRVVGVDHDPDYLEQARFAAEVSGVEIEFRELSAYDVAALGERFDVVLFLGVLYHLRHPLLALDLIHEHVARDLLVFQSLQRGSPEVQPLEPRLPDHRGRGVRAAWLSAPALHRAELLAGPDQLVAAEPRLRRGHAAQRRLRDHWTIPRRRSSSAAGSLARRVPRRSTPPSEDSDDRSRDDLERAQQQVALGLRGRPRVDARSPRWRGSRARRSRPRTRTSCACSAASRRSIPCSSRTCSGRAPSSAMDAVAVHGFPLDWNHWMIDEWPAQDRRDRGGRRAAGLGLGGRRLDLRRRGGPGVRA